MINLLKRGSRGTPAALSLCEEDIRKILETFPLEDHANASGIVALRSQAGLTTRHFISEKILEWTADDDYNTLQDLADRLDVSLHLVSECCKSLPNIVFATDGQRLRSRSSAYQISQRLHDRATKGFVDVQAFLLHHDVQLESLSAMSCSYLGMDLAGKRYTIAPSAKEAQQDRLRQMLEDAIREAKSISLSVEHFPGLDLAALKAWATQLLIELSATDPDHRQGRLILLDATDSVVSPNSSLAAQADALAGKSVSLLFVPYAIDKRRLAEASSALSQTKEFILLGEWAEQHHIVPEILPSLEAALDYVQNDMRDDAGNRIDVVVNFTPKTSTQQAILLLRKSLDKSAEDLWDQYAIQELINVSPSIARFPAEAQLTVQEYLMERLQTLARNRPRSASPQAWDRFDTIFFTTRLYQQVLTEVGSRIKSAATNKWTSAKGQPASQLTLERSDLRASPGASDTEDRDPYDTLISCVALHQKEQWTAWQRLFLDDVEQMSEAAFASTWRDRLTTRVQLYSTAITALPTSTLKDQLSELLRDHISKELLPQTVQRATERARGFVTEKTPKRLTKLRSKIADSASLDNCLTQISRFEDKNSPVIEPLSADEIRERQKLEVMALYKITREDKDCARRFLCAVLILLTSRSEGVLYATGRFAPKLLKTLSEEMAADEFKLMERFKDEAKKGAIVDDMAAQVDALLQKVVHQVWPPTA